MYTYILKRDDGSLALYAGAKLSDNYILEINQEDRYGKYKHHIKYIDCCYLDENHDLQIDLVKVLSNRLYRVEDISQTKIRELRKMLAEASALGRPDIVEEIVQTIKEINSFMDSDFSKIDNVADIDQLVCPELTLNYEELYSEKLYRI